MRSRLMSKLVLLIASLSTTALMLTSAAGERANVTLPDVIGDSMVLQRGVAVPVWGKAEPGDVVTVSFAGRTKKATANGEGSGALTLIR